MDDIGIHYVCMNDEADDSKILKELHGSKFF